MKIFNSIKGRLYIWSFVFISTLLVVVGFSIYYKVHNAIYSSIDRSLNSEIEIISGLLHVEKGRIEFELSEVISGEYSIPRSGHYYKVIIDGQVFAASQSLVDDSFDFTLHKSDYSGGQPGDITYTSIGPDDERIRVIQRDFEFIDKPATIYLAESLEESIDTIERIKLYLLIVIPVSILLAGFVSLLIVNYSLKPLRTFSDRVGQITHKNLNERISSQKQTEELTRLAESFNDMLNRLQKAFEVEKRIISDASHELKTPLSVIRTQCEVILQKSRTTEEYIEALETIKDSGKNMSKLVSDLLSLARLDSGLIETERFKMVSLRECLEEAAHAVTLLAEKNQVNINIDITDDIRISGNRGKLTEAILNIIENGVRYNRSGGSVEITLSRNNDKAEIRIKDTGTGIEASDLERIFERFYRADASRSTEGTGLGLSIAKAIIEAHGGAIRAESTSGRGSSFFITL